MSKDKICNHIIGATSGGALLSNEAYRFSLGSKPNPTPVVMYRPFKWCLKCGSDLFYIHTELIDYVLKDECDHAYSIWLGKEVLEANLLNKDGRILEVNILNRKYKFKHCPKCGNKL